jgi:putative sigma-54 modulation protein
MRFQYEFKNMPNSEFVIKAAEDKIGHAARFLLKSGFGQVWFSKKGHLFTVEVSIRAGGEGQFRARSQSENLYAAIDVICDKLEKQFVKKKDKIQKHKRYAFSKEGRMELMNNMLETDYSTLKQRGRLRKAA